MTSADSAPVAESSAARGVRRLTAVERAGMRSELLDVVQYRKSGLSLNHIVGCPVDCAYCVRHLFGNFGMRVPRAVVSDAEAVELLVGHRFFRPHVTPVQVFNRATDPMLPMVRPHTLRVLRLLDERGLTNHVLVITRWRVGPAECAQLNALRHLKVTVLVTYSGIDDRRVEPVSSAIAEGSLRTAFERARRYRVVLYWRPIVPGLNDTAEHLARAAELAESAHATVFTGLFFRDEIRDYYQAMGLPQPYPQTARRKVLPAGAEQRIVDHFRGHRPGMALFRKTSCAVAFAHDLADYNGHVGIRELCDICPTSQLRRCLAARRRPVPQQVATRIQAWGGELVEITDRAIVAAGLDEQHRYALQHEFGYQVHDMAAPHHPGRHGRADLGWPTIPAVAP